MNESVRKFQRMINYMNLSSESIKYFYEFFQDESYIVERVKLIGPSNLNRSIFGVAVVRGDSESSTKIQIKKGRFNDYLELRFQKLVLEDSLRELNENEIYYIEEKIDLLMFKIKELEIKRVKI